MIEIITLSIITGLSGFAFGYLIKALYDLANAEGVVFKVSQVNGCTVLERIDT